VVIPAWNAWEHTRTCLESLRPTLDPGDQVVVVDNGSGDGTREGLAAFGWVEVVTNADNQGFARACNQGAARARGEIVVFLNNDTVVPAGWLDELLWPFNRGDVGAVGPRSDNVSGRQHVADIPYAPDDQQRFFDVAESWRMEHHHEVSEIHRLVGFCLAIRTSLFADVGGFDEGYGIGGFEDDDLCRRVLEKGLRLVVADGSLVHHHAHATFDANDVDWMAEQKKNQVYFEQKWGPFGSRPPGLLSACLIVKDEERMLPACLESLRDAVDEIVVYDTGSSDDTVQIARAAGARVVEGTWEDSFATARNAALELATSRWVLSIDADETLLANPVAMRDQLATSPADVEAYLVAIENLHGAGNARSVHTAIRVFRRTAATWRHRIHEQVVAADDPTRELRTSYLSAARLAHHGYMAEVFDGRHKGERNLELARAALDDGEQARPYSLMNYGRALESVGRSEEAVDTLIEAVSIATDGITKRLATTNLIYILGRLGRYEESIAQVAELRRLSRSQVAADIAEGRIRLGMGQSEQGLAILARLPTRGRDDDGMEYAPHMVAAIRGEALASLDRFGEAADIVLDAVRSDGVLEVDIGLLVQWLLNAGRSPAEITASLTVEDLVPMLGRVLRQPPALADALLTGAWEKFPDRLEPLAAAARVAVDLPVARALVWSARLRARGLAASCPLVVIAGREELEPIVRIRAGAAAYGAFGDDQRLVQPVLDALGALDPLERLAALDEIGRLAPRLPSALEGDQEATGADGGPDDGGSGNAAGEPAATVAPVPERPERPSAPSRSGLRRVAAQQVVATARPGGLNIVAPFEGTSAEAEVGRRIATALRLEGVPISTTSYLRDHRDTSAPWVHHDAGDFPFDVNLLVIAPDHLSDFVLDNGPASFEGRYVVGLWLWDLQTPSIAMPDAARMVHEVWVPSKAGVATAQLLAPGSAHLLPLPAAARPAGLDRLKAGLPAGFVFATTVDYDDGYERQNPVGVMRAFSEAFAPGAGPLLVVDAVHAARYPSEHAELTELARTREDIVVVERGDRPADEADAVIALADCFVSLPRADASFVPVSKALAWGVPAIVTATPASRGFATVQDVLFVRSVPVPVPDHLHRYPTGAEWAEPDLDDAASAMRGVVADPEGARVRAGRAQASATRRRSSAELARFVRRRLARIDSSRRRPGPTATRRSRGPRGPARLRNG
jgi:GT2 family glycosyltransferase/tetratricopeptide (TPR) repeat protein